jgi:IclR family transcriptional regulator, acetate operon repressor
VATDRQSQVTNGTNRTDDTDDDMDDAAESGAKQRRGVQSINRAVAILRCFDADHPRLGITDVSRMTGLSTSTAHRLLTSMMDNGLIRQMSDRKYTLGSMLIQLTRSGAVPQSLREAALPLMEKLRDRVGETVGLHALLPSYERAVIDQVESKEPLRRTYTEFGQPIPLALGAPGKVLLAHLPYELQEQILTRPIPQATPTTPTDAHELRAQLAEIRNRNYALSFSERTAGIRTIASAIFEAGGNLLASVSVSAPAIRMAPEKMVELGPEVADTAWKISETLGASRNGIDRTLAAASPLPE